MLSKNRPGTMRRRPINSGSARTRDFSLDVMSPVGLADGAGSGATAWILTSSPYPLTPFPHHWEEGGSERPSALRSAAETRPVFPLRLAPRGQDRPPDAA